MSIDVIENEVYHGKSYGWPKSLTPLQGQEQYQGQSYGFPRQAINAQGNMMADDDLTYQMRQAAARQRMATSQRDKAFMGLGQTQTFVPNETAIITEDQRDYIIQYATAGAKAAAKFLAAASASKRDAWNKSVFWYNEAVKLAKSTLSMSYVQNGARNPTWQRIALEAKAASKLGDKWADKARAVVAAPSEPVAQKEPEKEIVVAPVDIQVQTVKSAGFKWWMVAAAIAVGYVVFKPKKKPEQQIDDLAGLG